jgi:hypothetical protein
MIPLAAVDFYWLHCVFCASQACLVARLSFRLYHFLNLFLSSLFAYPSGEVVRWRMDWSDARLLARALQAAVCALCNYAFCFVLSQFLSRFSLCFSLFSFFLHPFPRFTLCLAPLFLRPPACDLDPETPHSDLQTLSPFPPLHPSAAHQHCAACRRRLEIRAPVSDCRVQYERQGPRPPRALCVAIAGRVLSCAGMLCVRVCVCVCDACFSLLHAICIYDS